MIVNLQDIADYLDISDVSSSMAINVLQECASVDADPVITISQGEVTVTSQPDLEVVQGFLVDNEIISDTFSIPGLFAGCNDASLRPSELIRIMVELAVNYSTKFNANGYQIGGRSFSARVIGECGGNVVLGNTGAVRVNNYLDAQNCGLLTDVSISGSGVSYWSYNGCDGWLTVKEGYTVTVDFGDGQARTYGPFFSGDKLWEDFQTFSSYSFDQNATISFFKKDGYLWTRLNVTRSVRGDDAQWLQDRSATVESAVCRIPDVVVTKAPVISTSTFKLNWPYKNRTWPWEEYPSSTVTYSGVSPSLSLSGILYPYLFGKAGAQTSTIATFTLDDGSGIVNTVGVAVSETNSGTKNTSKDMSTVSISGSISGYMNNNIPYRAEIVTIPDDYTLESQYPQEIYTSTKTPQWLYFNYVPDGAGGSTPYVTCGGAVPTGGDSYGSWSSTTFVRIDKVNECIKDQDSISPIEGLTTVSIPKLKEFFGSIVPKSDPYYEMLIDNSCMIMCQSVVDAMLEMLAAGATKLNDRYGLHLFDNFDATSGSVYCVPNTAYVEVEDGVWQNVTVADCEWMSYSAASDTLTMLSDHKLKIDYFSIGGMCLSDAAQHPDANDDFVKALANLRLDVATQVTLYSVINGVINSTTWLADAGRWIADILSQARDATTQLLASLGRFEAFTISQKQALLAGQAYNAIPATRVAAIVDTLGSACADSLNGTLDILMSLGTLNSASQIQSETSKGAVDLLISRSNYAGYKPACTKGRPQQEDSYMSTFYSRTAAAVISAVGGSADPVASEVADMGVGLMALYPALIIGNFTNKQCGLPEYLASSVVLPLSHSFIVITSGYGAYNYDVAWYSATRGGNDLDILQDVELSLKEMKFFFETIATLPITFSYSDLKELTFVGDYDLVEVASIISATLTGAAVGALVAGAAGAGYGAFAGEMTAMIALGQQTDASKYNSEFNLLSLSGETIGLTYDGTTITDKERIGKVLAEFVLAALHHGAYYPYVGTGQIGTQYPSVECPGKPYFRYILTGAQHDWSPLILTGFGLLSVMSAKTVIKAWNNPARTPGFLPIMLASAGAGATRNSVGAAYTAIAAENDPTYDMQRKILAAVEEGNPSESGTYTDDEGTITLRDLANAQKSALDQMTALLESVKESTKPTSFVY